MPHSARAPSDIALCTCVHAGVYKVQTIGDAYMVAVGHDEDASKARLGPPIARALQVRVLCAHASGQAGPCLLMPGDCSLVRSAPETLASKPHVPSDPPPCP